MRVRIYRPTKTAMQSGRARTHGWLVEPELYAPRTPEPLMGWIAADDTLVELLGKLRFPTREEAIAFATHKGWEYTLEEPHNRKVVPRNYLDNFKWRAPEAADGKNGNGSGA